MKNSLSIKMALFTALVLLVISVSACQPTPDTPPVVGKGDNHLEEMIASSAVSQPPSPGASLPPEETEDPAKVMAALRESLGAPQTLKDQYTNKKGDITVYIEANVEAPAVSALPAMEVKLRAFTQDDVDSIAEYFLKGAPVFTEDRSVHTKEEVQAMLLDAQNQLSESRNRGDAEDSPVTKQYEKQLEERIGELIKQYQEASEKRERTPATLLLADTDYGTHLSVVADLGKDGGASLSVGSSAEGSVLFFENQGKGMYMPAFFGEGELNGIPNGMKLTLEEARGIVEKFLADFGIDYMQIADVKSSIYHENMIGSIDLSDPGLKQCYQFDLERVVGGIPVPNIDASTANEGDDPSIPKPKEPEYQNVANPERLMIFVDDTGIVMLQWDNPSEETAVLSDNVTLMQFPEIVEKAKDYMFYKTYTASNCRCDIHITKIRLSMMRIMAKDKPGQYMLVPVWDFIGNREDFVNGSEPDWLPFGDQSYVTINAIDGSNINRDWGY